MDKRENQDKLTDAVAPPAVPKGPMSSALAATLAGARNMTFPELEKLTDLTIAREQSAMRTDVLFGLASGSLESQKPGSNLDRHNRLERERLLRQQSKAKGSDIELLALLESGQHGAYIASAVFDSMADADVSELVADIEAKTGKPFEEYAKEILGDAMPKQQPGESETDYLRRVLKDVTEEVLDTSDPTNIRFKPGYEDDPVAGFLKKNEEYQNGTKVVADRVNAEVSATGVVTEEHEQEVESEADRGVGVGWQLEGDIEAEQLQNVAAESQEEEWTEDLNDLAVQTGADEFALFAAPSPMEVASTKGRMDFAAAASPDQPEQTPDTEPTAPVFAGTDFTRNV